MNHHPRDKTPYSTDQLKAALESLLLPIQTNNALQNGHDSNDINNNDYNEHLLPHHGVEPLSMLQVITATRILDYNQSKQLNTNNHTNNSNNGGATELALDLESNPPARSGNILNLHTVIRNQAPSMALAGEFKRASPSKGNFCCASGGRTSTMMNAGEQAQRYVQAGACIVSVLTEPHWFQGSLADLLQVRRATASYQPRPAILRKDFVINTTMIDEAVQHGADTVLLIVAVLPFHVLKHLIQYCRTHYNHCPLEPLVEVHTNAELEVAIHAGAKVIGVNNRNLHTFQLDLHTSTRIAQHLFALAAAAKAASAVHHDDAADVSISDMILCALSGISTADDVDTYRQCGIQMCLVGESLMRASDPQRLIRDLCLHPSDYYDQALRRRRKKCGEEQQQQEQPQQLPQELVEKAATSQSQSQSPDELRLVVKVCGITSVDDALAACRSGVNLIGVIFAERSPRKVTVAQACPIVQAVRAFGERNHRLALLPTSFAHKEKEDVEVEDEDILSHLQTRAKRLAVVTQRTPGVVGVFQNQDLAWIESVVNTTGLDFVQLHGQEGMVAANARNFGVPAIRVVDIPVTVTSGSNGNTHIVSTDTIEATLIDSITRDPFAILLDTTIVLGESSSASSTQSDGDHGAHVIGHGGGTGKAFDWNIAARLQAQGVPVIVAGGLTADSVQACVRIVRPLGVDVSSGVEEVRGIKDHDKVRCFVQNARNNS